MVHEYTNHGKENRQSMQKTIDHLNFINSHCIETERYLNKESLSLIQYTCIGLLERLSSSALALSVLLPLINTKQNIDFSCGLILRSSILDYLIVLNIYIHVLEKENSENPIEEDKDPVLAFCTKCLADGLPQTFSYINAAKKAGVISPQQQEIIFNNMAKNYAVFLESHPGDGSTPKTKSKHLINARDLFIKIADHPDIKDFAKIYDSYVGYSKYDHFGVMYFDVIRQTHLQKLAQISKAVEHLVGSQSFLHMILRLHSSNDKFLNNQSDIAAKYLFDNIIYTVNDESDKTEGK